MKNLIRALSRIPFDLLSDGPKTKTWMIIMRMTENLNCIPVCISRLGTISSDWGYRLPSVYFLIHSFDALGQSGICIAFSIILQSFDSFHGQTRR